MKSQGKDVRTMYGYNIDGLTLIHVNSDTAPIRGIVAAASYSLSIAISLFPASENLTFPPGKFVIKAKSEPCSIKIVGLVYDVIFPASH